MDQTLTPKSFVEAKIVKIMNFMLIFVPPMWVTLVSFVGRVRGVTVAHVAGDACA